MRRTHSRTRSLLRVALLVGSGALFFAYPNSGFAGAKPTAVKVSYKEGYKQGCSIGVSDAWRNRVSGGFPPINDKPEQYASDPDFRSGWDEGYKSCYEKTEFPQGRPSGAPAQ